VSGNAMFPAANGSTADDPESGRHAVPAPSATVDPAPTSYGEFLADATVAIDEMADPEPVPAFVDVSTRELVTCPECGATQDVQLNRRDAVDFCQRCDFPLFWAPQQPTRDRETGAETESLRRLPGTVGRSTLASVPCPHCFELNTVSAVVCVRCERSMHPVEPAPPPPALPPPPPEPVYVEPERATPWWVWLVVAFGAGAIAMVVLTLSGVIF
jgi:hypothetical protein